MTLNQLEYFVAVAESLSFTKAAERCYISQAAITMQIRTLEQDLGVSLFMRSKHHVELTAAGAVYLNEARAILARVGDSRRIVRTLAEGITGELTIGFVRGYEKSGFSSVIRGFQAAYPNIRLNFIRDNSNALFRRFQEHRCDLIFNLLLHQPNPNYYHRRFLKSYALYAAVRRDNPIAQRPFISYRDLAGQNFYIMQPEGRAADETEESLFCYERGGFVPNIIGREEEPDMLIFRTSISGAVCVLPEYTIRYFGQTDTVAFVPLLKDDGTPESLDMNVLWHRNSSNPSLQHFLSWMKENRLAD